MISNFAGLMGISNSCNTYTIISHNTLLLFFEFWLDGCPPSNCPPLLMPFWLQISKSSNYTPSYRGKRTGKVVREDTCSSPRTTCLRALNVLLHWDLGIKYSRTTWLSSWHSLLEISTAASWQVQFLVFICIRLWGSAADPGCSFILFNIWVH
jgi:hypothetical protein